MERKVDFLLAPNNLDVEVGVPAKPGDVVAG